MNFWLLCFIVFSVMFIADVCWAFYIMNVQEKESGFAALWSIALFLAGAVGTISYVNDPWLLIPACVGVASGTYIAVYIKLRKESNKERNKASEILKMALTSIMNNENVYGCSAIHYGKFHGEGSQGYTEARKRAMQYFQKFKPPHIYSLKAAWWEIGDHARVVAFEKAIELAIKYGD